MGSANNAGRRDGNRAAGQRSAGCGTPCSSGPGWQQSLRRVRSVEGCEDHRRACECMVQGIFDGDDAREAVRQALETLRSGATRTKMENARDGALAPFRAATKADADADRYLQHVFIYIEELGNEETGEWDLGDWSERYQLAAKLKTKLKPRLIKKLIEDNLQMDDANDFIEQWIDQEFESED